LLGQFGEEVVVGVLEEALDVGDVVACVDELMDNRLHARQYIKAQLQYPRPINRVDRKPYITVISHPLDNLPVENRERHFRHELGFFFRPFLRVVDGLEFLV